MTEVERYQKWKEIPFDNILLAIRNGRIKSGKYSKLVKINYKFKKEPLSKYE